MNAAPHLVLVGPMGAGKSTLGQALADRWGLPFVDLDRAIEAEAGLSIPAIFAAEGEPGFRRREREALAAALAGAPSVIATGGGAVLAAENRAALRAHAFVVFLRIGVDEQLQRLANDRERPLIAGGDREAVLRRLAEERAPLYAETADHAFPVDGTTPSEALDGLTDLLRRVWTMPSSSSSSSSGVAP